MEGGEGRARVADFAGSGRLCSVLYVGGRNSHSDEDNGQLTVMRMGVKGIKRKEENCARVA